jgi:hypothetical protein
MSATTTTIDYNKVREMLGVVVTDGYYEYVVSDYKMGCEAFQLWCKSRQAYYYTGHDALDILFEVVSG